MPDYAIYRTRKLFRGRGKNGLGVCIRHLDRHQQSADITHPEDSEYNDIEKYYEGKVENTIKKVLAKHEEVTGKALRSDSSVAVEMIFTYSPEAEIDDNEFDERVKQFIKSEFPHMQVLRIDYHADETTPHWHVVGIPTTKDGRICAKEVLGGPAEFRKHQTNFAKMVADLGLQRGIPKAVRQQRGENVRHTSLRAWKGAMVSENATLKEKNEYLESEEYQKSIIIKYNQKKAQKERELMQKKAKQIENEIFR